MSTSPRLTISAPGADMQVGTGQVSFTPAASGDQTQFALTAEEREAVDRTVQALLHTLPLPDACDHVWDGPGLTHADGCGWSATCSRCGLDAMTYDLRRGL